MADLITTKDITITGEDTTTIKMPYVFATSAAVSIGSWSTNLFAYKPKYKCAYCGTIHENNLGICDRCGAPLGAAEEI